MTAEEDRPTRNGVVVAGRLSDALLAARVLLEETSSAADPELRLVPALIAAAGDAAGWRYVECQYPQPQHASRLCTGVRPFLRLVRRARPDAPDDPTP